MDGVESILWGRRVSAQKREEVHAEASEAIEEIEEESVARQAKARAKNSQPHSASEVSDLETPARQPDCAMTEWSDEYLSE